MFSRGTLIAQSWCRKGINSFREVVFLNTGETASAIAAQALFPLMTTAGLTFFCGGLVPGKTLFRFRYDTVHRVRNGSSPTLALQPAGDH